MQHLDLQPHVSSQGHCSRATGICSASQQRPVWPGHQGSTAVQASGHLHTARGPEHRTRTLGCSSQVCPSCRPHLGRGPPAARPVPASSCLASTCGIRTALARLQGGTSCPAQAGRRCRPCPGRTEAGQPVRISSSRLLWLRQPMRVRYVTLTGMAVGTSQHTWHSLRTGQAGRRPRSGALERSLAGTQRAAGRPTTTSPRGSSSMSSIPGRRGRRSWRQDTGPLVSTYRQLLEDMRWNSMGSHCGQLHRCGPRVPTSTVSNRT